MRRVLLFVVAVGLIGAGTYFVFLQVFYSLRIYPMWIGGAVGMAILGIYLLWEEFLRRLWRRGG